MRSAFFRQLAFCAGCKGWQAIKELAHEVSIERTLATRTVQFGQQFRKMRGMRPRELDFITTTGPEEKFNGTLNMQTVESIVGCTR
jgi:hypothetical protein